MTWETGYQMTRETVDKFDIGNKGTGDRGTQGTREDEDETGWQ